VLVLTMLDQIKDHLPELPSDDFWEAVAIYQDAEWALSLDKTPLGRIVSDRIVSIKSSDQSKLTWDMIHLLAQIHGSYYSFRILKQILELLILFAGEKSISGEMLQLCKRLESLPPISTLRGFRDIIPMI